MNVPALNHATQKRTASRIALVHSRINLGIAVDVAAKDGRSASLMVPNITKPRR